jgi:hypothetical protein
MQFLQNSYQHVNYVKTCYCVSDDLYELDLYAWTEFTCSDTVFLYRWSAHNYT